MSTVYVRNGFEVDNLDEDIQGAIYEVAEFAGLAGDEGEDPDFEALPKEVQLAIRTIASWEDFGTQTRESRQDSPVETAVSTSPRTSADARAEAVAKGPSTTTPTLTLHKGEGAIVKTKEYIWDQIQTAAHGLIDVTDLGGGDAKLTIEQAIAAYLNTPAGSKAYEEWKRAPWATQGDSYTATVQKSESEPLVIREAVQKARAERVAGLHALAASMTAAAK